MKRLALVVALAASSFLRVINAENPIIQTHFTPDLYFLFNGDGVTSGRELFNFDYWMFQ